MSQPLADPLDESPSPTRQLQDLQVLLGVARGMAAHRELDDLLNLILESARGVLHAERSTLFLYDANTHELYSQIAQESKQIRFPADRGIAGAALMTRQTINIPDAYSDSRFNRDIDRQTGYRTRCLLTVPLTGFEEQLVGVLQVLNKLNGVFTRYDERLAEALAAQIGVAIQRAHLMEHYVHKMQLESSLALAREIQQNLLPKKPPVVPGYEIAGYCCPTDATGGDYYDYTLVEGKLFLTVADATGHGIGPALEVSNTRALVRALAGYVSDASALLSQANTWLCGDLTEGRFVTAFLGILDPATHVMSYASAGHGPLFWYQAASGTVTFSDATGLPLGLAEGLPILLGEPVAFEAGDIGAFLTDGMIEAHDPEGKCYGKDKIVEVLKAHAHLTPEEIVAVLERTVRAYLNGAPQHDDWTAVIVKRRA